MTLFWSIKRFSYNNFFLIKQENKNNLRREIIWVERFLKFTLLYKVMIFYFITTNKYVKFPCFENKSKIIGTFLRLCDCVFSLNKMFVRSQNWNYPLVHQVLCIHTVSVTQSGKSTKENSWSEYNCFKYTIWSPYMTWNCKIGWAIAELKWPKGTVWMFLVGHQIGKLVRQWVLMMV